MGTAARAHAAAPKKKKKKKMKKKETPGGDRTRGHRIKEPALCQLSYEGYCLFHTYKDGAGYLYRDFEPPEPACGARGARARVPKPSRNRPGTVLGTRARACMWAPQAAPGARTTGYKYPRPTA